MFSSIEAPPAFAEVLKAGLFECAENVLVSIPVSPKNSKISLETVCADKALCVFRKVNNS